jgi:hypothetical protein
MRRIIIGVVGTIMSLSGAQAFERDPYFDTVNSQCVDGVFETNSQWTQNVLRAGLVPTEVWHRDLNRCSREAEEKRKAEMNRAYGRASFFRGLGNAFHGNNVPTDNMYQINY